MIGPTDEFFKDREITLEMVGLNIDALYRCYRIWMAERGFKPALPDAVDELANAAAADIDEMGAAAYMWEAFAAGALYSASGQAEGLPSDGQSDN